MTAFCDQCGAALTPGSAFCEMCGHPVPEASEPVAESDALPAPTFADDEVEILYEDEVETDDGWGNWDADREGDASDVKEPVRQPPADERAAITGASGVDVSGKRVAGKRDLERTDGDEPVAERRQERPSPPPPRRRWLGWVAGLAVVLVVAAVWATWGDDDDVYRPFYMGAPAYADDFSDPGSGWEVWENERSSARYEGGQLHVRQSAAGRMAVSQASRFFEDLALEVEAAPIALPSGSSFGLIIGFEGEENYTQLEVAERGAYRIVRVRHGTASLIADWTPFPAPEASGVTRLGAMRDGRSLLFSLNGRPLPESVADLPPGDIAVFVATPEAEAAEVHVAFDNIKVWVP